jgi:hypothetical protein
MKDINNFYEHIHELKKNINSISNELIGEPFFWESSLVTSKSSNFKFEFKELISMLYSWYQEVCKKNLIFILPRIKTINEANYDKLNNYKNIVITLRTYFQHNLFSFEEPIESSKIKFCEQWFFDKCGFKKPVEGTQWKILLVDVLEGAVIFFKEILFELKSINSLESVIKESVVEQWMNINCRTFGYHHYEKIFITVVKKLGYESLDALYICKKNTVKWNKELENLKDGFNFEQEATRLIEKFIFETQPLPITGNDIIKYLKIESGRKVALVIARARDIYYSSSRPYSKDELLKEIIKLNIT